jgi:hypothetical protein
MRTLFAEIGTLFAEIGTLFAEIQPDHDGYMVAKWLRCRSKKWFTEIATTGNLRPDASKTLSTS